MSDVHDPQVRSRNMRAIRARDTKPELAIRRILHRSGFRFRLHVRLLPGTPDIVLPKYRAVVFVHGCFWHQHGCSLFRMPGTRQQFWREKISRNVERDSAVVAKLLAQGWRVATIWECSIKGRNKLGPEAVGEELSAWLRNVDAKTLDIAESAPCD